MDMWDLMMIVSLLLLALAMRGLLVWAETVAGEGSGRP